MPYNTPERSHSQLTKGRSSFQGRVLLQIPIWTTLLSAQPAVLTLQDAVSKAVVTYPETRVASAQVSAASAGIGLARTSYLPRLDLLNQTNRATYNNVFGMVLPQSTLPGISGPPRPVNSFRSVWGSLVGFQVGWEPFDFGLRRANVEVAEAGHRGAERTLERTRFEIQVAAADAFLAAVAAERAEAAARAGVERARVLLDVVEAQVKSQLRPGADASRARAELAVAQNQLTQARLAIETTRASLVQLAGSDVATAKLEDGLLLGIPPETVIETNVPSQHPALAEQTSAIEQAEARRRAVARSYFPRFNLQAASYARGTGALPDGTPLGGVSGLGPNIHNWGIGFSLSFAAFDLPAIRGREQIERYRTEAEAARRDKLAQDLTADIQRALAQIRAAREIAGNTPLQLAAARAAEEQATARYKAGLATIVEVAEAQRLVTQAETDDALARLNVWRAVLSTHVAQGNIEPFLQQVR
jgi:outer membrane protein